MGWAKIPGTNMEQFTDASGKVIATQPLDGKLTDAPTIPGASALSTTPTTPGGAGSSTPSLDGINTVAGSMPGFGDSAEGGALGSVAGMLGSIAANGEADGNNNAAALNNGVLLRPLGMRTKPTDSMALAGLGRRVY